MPVSELEESKIFFPACRALGSSSLRCRRLFAKPGLANALYDVKVVHLSVILFKALVSLSSVCPSLWESATR